MQHWGKRLTGRYSKASDVFALGLLFTQILSPGQETHQVLQDAKTGSFVPAMSETEVRFGSSADDIAAAKG